jgi:hypothetical protein
LRAQYYSGRNGGYLHYVSDVILDSTYFLFSGTASVNTYGEILASCMRDPSILIRKHAVFLVTTLIRDEYFKWKSQVMYFFLGALLDPDFSVRDQVHASLVGFKVVDRLSFCLVECSFAQVSAHAFQSFR